MPVIVITGHGDIALAVEAMKAGAVDFIEKPFDDEVLIGAIKVGPRAPRRRRASARRAPRRRARACSSCRSASARCSTAWLPASPTRSSPMSSTSAPRTVEIYRANVMTKMQADSLSALVRMALLADRTESPRADLALDQFAAPEARVKMLGCCRPSFPICLVVDDDAAVRNALKFALEVEGFGFASMMERRRC